jgi:hypothetical protein
MSKETISQYCPFKIPRYEFYSKSATYFDNFIVQYSIHGEGVMGKRVRGTLAGINQNFGNKSMLLRNSFIQVGHTMIYDFI